MGIKYGDCCGRVKCGDDGATFNASFISLNCFSVILLFNKSPTRLFPRNVVVCDAFLFSKRSSSSRIRAARFS
eukprot:UN00653